MAVESYTNYEDNTLWILKPKLHDKDQTNAGTWINQAFLLQSIEQRNRV